MDLELRQVFVVVESGEACTSDVARDGEHGHPDTRPERSIGGEQDGYTRRGSQGIAVPRANPSISKPAKMRGAES